MKSHITWLLTPLVDGCYTDLKAVLAEKFGFFNIEELASDERPRVRAAAGQLLEAMK